jgi:hypothetical protein
MDFSTILPEIKDGYPVRRRAWPDGLFVFMQIPSIINPDIIPKMTSLSDQVKEVLVDRRLPLVYQDQLALCYPNNVIVSYALNEQDIFNNDWEIYTK